MTKTRRPLDGQFAGQFILGFVEERTKGSSSQHKLPTEGELWSVTDKYFTRDAAEAALADLVERGQIIRDACYLCTERKEIL